MIGDSLTTTDNVPLCKHCGKPVRNIVKVTGMDAGSNILYIVPDAHPWCMSMAMVVRAEEEAKKPEPKKKFWEYYNRRNRRRR